MQKKVIWTLSAIIIVLLAAVGSYKIFHKSTTNNTSPGTYGSSSQAPVNNGIVLTKNIDTVGQYLTDTNGKTLYYYSSDTKGISKCLTECLAAWPPYYDIGPTANLPTNIGVIKRSDTGKYQYTYKGLPLYYYINDTKAGDVNGNGADGFYVVKP